MLKHLNNNMRGHSFETADKTIECVNFINERFRAAFLYVVLFIMLGQDCRP